MWTMPLYLHVNQISDNDMIFGALYKCMDLFLSSESVFILLSGSSGSNKPVHHSTLTKAFTACMQSF